ncbi:ATP-dependent Clp protease proteolytic subunit [Planotetraspora phitsanulokensis]|uniref:ATP-dependent Clp protease proteolytic subunit n=1 Tax=Planotetraspora phitsanulokensis TaxID=575192 RepID=A0A8J3XEC3_9ACTN|nr:ATP-dependent Clp protease proteolytic subunit [Planotetraspora phitsanulokensis]GII37955.1 ATP-dependent Clp protease proteolytic subunit 1 [Planotetraspora phitsanulokensis]
MIRPASRHVLPEVVERTSHGTIVMDPYSKLLAGRIIFLGTPIDDASANDVMAQMLYLDYDNPERDISLYINSPGGSFTAMMSIYDTMQYVAADVETVCMGQAASAAAVLLAAGTPGKRLALPRSRVLVHQPSSEGQGQFSDLEIHARELLRARALTETLLAKHTGQSEECVRRDIERDKILNANEAVAYGIVDAMVDSRKTVPIW